MKHKVQQNKGYAILDLLFYIAIFAVLILAMINSFITMAKAFKETTIYSTFVQSSSIIERISREVRQSYGIVSIGANDLKLNTKDEIGNNKTVRFVLSGQNVQFFENDVFVSNLNTPSVQVTNLSFVEITTTAGKAVKITLSISVVGDSGGRSEIFYDTVVLRGSY